jgi:hypothetical protein
MHHQHVMLFCGTLTPAKLQKFFIKSNHVRLIALSLPFWKWLVGLWLTAQCKPTKKKKLAVVHHKMWE